MNLKPHQYKTKMGKKIIGVISFAAIAVAAGWNYQQNKQEVELSDLALENVEALARNEIENYYDFHLVSYSSGCKICERDGTWCNVHDQVPC